MTETTNPAGSRRRFPIFVAAGAFTAALIVWSVFSVMLAPQAGPGRHPTDAAGWGQEAVESLGAQVATLSPIAAANACGMGASSCFKCHNGQRAVAPKIEKATAPWHVDHKTVNNSCAGCHKGNPRLIKQDLAHAQLIKDPRQSTKEVCGSCHKTGNAAELNNRYQK
jgi:hypothetical protein